MHSKLQHLYRGMRKPPPAPTTYFGFTPGKWVIVTEAALVLYAYFVYHRLNKYQDFRYRYHKKYPWILDKYYKVGELLGGLDTRQTDLEYWKSLEAAVSDQS